MYRVKRILFATDLSPESQPAFDRAVDLASSSEAKLTILHVIAPLPAATLELNFYGAIESAHRGMAERLLKGLEEKALEVGAEVRAMLVEGRPAEEILRVAEDQRPDVLVLGTHGRRGWDRFLLGSVASRVVAAAPCPVLTIRNDIDALKAAETPELVAHI